jgi:hypothetical protein
VTGLPEKIVSIDRALTQAGFDHAFGGALALAWCTRRARGTIDIDVNVFVNIDRTRDVFSVLPEGVRYTEIDIERTQSNGQVRLWWEETPIDVFLNTTEFHDQIGTRTRVEKFAGALVPFLSCTDLAVFKAFFNRTRDWADLEEMAEAGTLDFDRLIGVLVRYLGATDGRIERLRSLAGPDPAAPSA